MSKVPFLDRQVLVKEIESFAGRFNAYVKAHTKRMSDYYEMSAYNEIVRYYKHKKYDVMPLNLKNGEFKYRLSPTALKDTCSYFSATKKAGRWDDAVTISLEIHHNLRIQSACDKHLFYNADIAVCYYGGTKSMRENGRQKDFICNERLISFFEVKNLVPFPEILFNFSGLLLEFLPKFISGEVSVSELDTYSAVDNKHICPGMFFSGSVNDNTKRIILALKNRYNHNFILGLAYSKGKIHPLRGLKEYELQLNL